MRTNKITAIRLANLAEQEDSGLDSLINYEKLQIYPPLADNDVAAKKKYIRELHVGGRMKIIHILEEGLKVVVHFYFAGENAASLHFHVYRFDQQGMLREAWINSQPLMEPCIMSFTDDSLM